MIDSHKQINVMISSTSLDLLAHRKEVLDACLRLGLRPLMMEYLDASGDVAIAASLRLVDQANVYVGVIAHRYGYVPDGYDISITEMEYNHAIERGIERFILLIDQNQPLGNFKIEDIDTGENAIRLKRFKKRLEKENIINYFKSPEDLRAHVISNLCHLRTPELSQLHYVSDISMPPTPYVAHPYVLLQTRRLIGRQPELNLLTDWVACREGCEVPPETRLLAVVAIGGMGKSALTWTWFNEIAPLKMKPLEGQMWWSFYESDASFENFIIRALAYVSRQSREEVQKLPPPEREEQLLTILNREPFLLVLDGLERILIAYARPDAAHLVDDDFDRQTANFLARSYGLPGSSAKSFAGQHRLRLTANPRAGAFLRRLAHMKMTRTLISSRLYPFELQSSITGDPLPGCYALLLPGLTDDDSLNLWRVFGVSGTRDELLPLFHSFQNHPLLIQALASEITNYHRAPGDFESWKKGHPAFNPYTLPLTTARSHVLAYALGELNDHLRQVLATIASLHIPATYDTLAALFVGESKLFPDEISLDAALSELEDRGLMGWDRRANRYDLHPIVRGVVWSGMDQIQRRNVLTGVESHFSAKLQFENWLKINSVDDLTPAIELFNARIGQQRFDDAYNVFADRISKATHFRLGTSRINIELLLQLFPDGEDNPPRLKKTEDKASAINALALAYDSCGQLERAALLYRRHIELCEMLGDQQVLGIGLLNLSDTMRLLEQLYSAEAAANRALRIGLKQTDLFLKGGGLMYLGLIQAQRGRRLVAQRTLRRAIKPFDSRDYFQAEGVIDAYLAQAAIWWEDYPDALKWANQAWEYAQLQRIEIDFIRAECMQGQALLGLGDLNKANERLHDALSRARAIDFFEIELPTLVTLAEMARREGNAIRCRELLEEVWEYAERGPFPAFYADALNLLAQVERDAGNVKESIDAATKAYTLAWSDGEPFAYHWGLIVARRHLSDLGAPEPTLQPFDASKFEPILEVENDLPDEFGEEEIEY